LLGAVAASAVAPSTPELARLQEARNVGLAALEEGKLPEAQRRLETVRGLAPEDPLGWADGAVAALRAKDSASAAKLMAEALRLAPATASVAALEGVRSEGAGVGPGALPWFDRGVALEPRDLVSRWNAIRLRSEADRARAIRDLES